MCRVTLKSWSCSILFPYLLEFRGRLCLISFQNSLFIDVFEQWQVLFFFSSLILLLNTDLSKDETERFGSFKAITVLPWYLSEHMLPVQHCRKTATIACCLVGTIHCFLGVESKWGQNQMFLSTAAFPSTLLAVLSLKLLVLDIYRWDLIFTLFKIWSKQICHNTAKQAVYHSVWEGMPCWYCQLCVKAAWLWSCSAGPNQGPSQPKGLALDWH